MKWLNPGIWLAILLAIAAAAGGGYWRGEVSGTTSERTKWTEKENARITAEQVALFKAIERNERIRQQQQIDTVKLKKGHANEIATVRAAYAADRGLRINAKFCNGFAISPEADGAGRGDAGTAATGLLPEPYNRDIKALMLEADAIVAGCRVGQEFIRTNGMAP